ncbi:MAG: hypothetical protein ACLPPF_21200 [Rhodomicrobium sp.]
MSDMKWAQFGIDYLAKAWEATHEDFNDVMRELRENNAARGTSWYTKCKSIAPSLYHYSLEFTGDREIPGNTFSSPEDFAKKLGEYKAFVETLARDLDEENEVYKRTEKLDSSPFLVQLVSGRVSYVLEAINYVTSMRSGLTSAGSVSELALAERLATRFHESVLALKNHPHNGPVLAITNEWDCQYLFRSILAAYFRDVRLEEWSPSVAGSSSRCEFFLKQARAMLELKYVHKASDQKKVKYELLTDFADYGANAEVDSVVVLIYDPQHLMEAAVQLQEDLSGPSKGLKDIRVIVSPPR